MTTGESDSHKSYVYVGLAGETGPGRTVQSGLYRMSNENGGWELAASGLPEAPAIRAIAVHPQKPEIVYVGTQNGTYVHNLRIIPCVQREWSVKASGQ